MSAPGFPANDWLLMKRGTTADLTRRTVIPFTVALSEEDPMYQEKIDVMGGKTTQRTFMLWGDLNT